MTLERHALQDSAFSFRYCPKPGQRTIGRCCHLCQSITQALSKVISQNAVQFCLIFKIVFFFLCLMQRHKWSLIIQLKMLFVFFIFFLIKASTSVENKKPESLVCAVTKMPEDLKREDFVSIIISFDWSH